MEEIETIKNVDEVANEIMNMRGKPLLVLYYPEEFSSINRDDISLIYDELDNGLGGVSVQELDLLLHTNGGDPNASYRIIQAIRELADRVNVLVPFHAYSGGTLICLGTDKILLGAYAAVSPIDITLVHDNSKNNDDDIPLICIDKYVEFTRYCKNALEQQEGKSTNVEEPLLLRLVDTIGVIKIAEYFRERELTKYYAEVLLMDYMFKENPDKLVINDICQALVFQSPSHEFEIDYNIAKKLNLNVERMPKDLSDKTKKLIKCLEIAMQAGEICMSTDEFYRQPYIRLYKRGE
jgi:hypothetical protein